MLNNLRDLYHKREESNEVKSAEEDELAISQTGFSFFIGMSWFRNVRYPPLTETESESFGHLQRVLIRYVLSVSVWSPDFVFMFHTSDAIHRPRASPRDDAIPIRPGESSSRNRSCRRP